MQDLIGWFESLASSKQVDEILYTAMNDVYTWAQNLSLNQRLVLAVSTFLLIIILKITFRFIYMSFIKIRRWFRRKLIPRKVDLHLDRERDSK